MCSHSSVVGTAVFLSLAHLTLDRVSLASIFGRAMALGWICGTTHSLAAAHQDELHPPMLLACFSSRSSLSTCMHFTFSTNSLWLTLAFLDPFPFPFPYPCHGLKCAAFSAESERSARPRLVSFPGPRLAQPRGSSPHPFLIPHQSERQRRKPQTKDTRGTHAMEAWRVRQFHLQRMYQRVALELSPLRWRSGLSEVKR